MKSDNNAIVQNEPLTMLQFDKKKYSLNDVKKDSLLTYDFIVKNTGPNVLKIYSLNPNCLCTNYYITKNIIEPQDTAKITLFFDTTGKSGFYDINAVVTANTEEKYYLLRLIGKVKE